MRSVPLDPNLPWLDAALDVRSAGPAILTALRDRAEWCPNTRVTGSVLARHKLGRRALIQYTVADGRRAPVTVFGKTHSRGVDHRTAALHDRLGAVDLAPGRIPRVLGIAPSLELWLQEQADGLPGFEALALPDGGITAGRIGRALARFHLGAPLGDRRHRLGDELAALVVRLTAVAGRFPRVSDRIAAVKSGLTALVIGRPSGSLRGLHRDFYPDQVLVSDTDIHLLDLDLHAAGDPALDVGNFLAHLLEHDLRHGHDNRPLYRHAAAFVDGYREGGGAADAATIGLYETLTLARHVALSTQLPHRLHTTERLLRLVEQRLAEAAQ